MVLIVLAIVRRVNSVGSVLTAIMVITMSLVEGPISYHNYDNVLPDRMYVPKLRIILVETSQH